MWTQVRTQLTPTLAAVGALFQNYALFPHLTVEQNVAFPLEMEGMNRREALSRS